MIATFTHIMVWMIGLTCIGTAHADWKRKVHDLCEKHLIADDPRDFIEAAARMSNSELRDVIGPLAVQVDSYDLARQRGDKTTFDGLQAESRARHMFKAVIGEIRNRHSSERSSNDSN